jgi:cellulose synthase (UDP-forming)
MAIFFASERPKFRNSERVFANEDACIVRSGQSFNGKTVDISETGVSIILEKPIFLDLNENHQITIETFRNTSTFLAKIVRVDNFNKNYKYVFNISEIDEENFSELLLILYDRVPPFPEIQNSANMIGNIFSNIKNRRKRNLPLNRKLPRVNIDKQVEIITEQKNEVIHILDFNYMYISVKKTEEFIDFVIPLSEEHNINLNCVLDKNLSQKNREDVLLYKIINYNEFTNYDIVSLLNLDLA